MMSHPILWNTVSIAVMRQDGLLPLTETVQRLVSMMINFQIWLQKTDMKNKVIDENTISISTKKYWVMLNTCGS